VLDIIEEQIQKGENATFLAADVSEIGGPTQSIAEKEKENMKNEGFRFWLCAFTS